MSSLTIRLRIDPATGKKDILIDYHSDSDALPMEHEEEHRLLVEKLINGGVLQAGEVGKIVVERVHEPQEQMPSAEPTPSQEERTAIKV